METVDSGRRSGLGLVALFPSYIEPSSVSVIWGIAAPVAVVAVGWWLRRGERRTAASSRRPSTPPLDEEAPSLAPAGSAGRSGS